MTTEHSARTYPPPCPTPRSRRSRHHRVFTVFLSLRKNSGGVKDGRTPTNAEVEEKEGFRKVRHRAHQEPQSKLFTWSTWTTPIVKHPKCIQYHYPK